MNKRLGRSTLVGLIVAVGCIAIPASAAATGIYPAGATYHTASTPMSFTVPGGSRLACKLSFSTVIPSAPNNSTPGTLTFDMALLRPRFYSCAKYAGFDVIVTTSGTWTQSLTWGAMTTTASINVPANGITIDIPGLSASGTNLSARAFTGTWQNGTASPFQKSVMTLWGGPMIQWAFASGPVAYPFDMHPTPITINNNAVGQLITVSQF
jgi:hypothetical protein